MIREFDRKIAAILFFAIVLLQKVLEKHSGKIRVEEMFPNGEEMMGDSVAEFAIQWRLVDQSVR